MSNAMLTNQVSSQAMVDPFGRQVRSLRLSITQRCDLACDHCHHEGQTPSAREMSPSEIGRLIATASSLGVRKVKITGGEPLVRDDLEDIISKISPFVDEVSLTTNGTTLNGRAAGLKKAGLARINVSLHTLDPDRYARLCGVNRLGQVLKGIEEAVSSGLTPVKVNMVVLNGENNDEIQAMIDYCSGAGAMLQLIELEADREGSNGCHFASRYFSLKATEKALASISIQDSVNELHRRKRFKVPSNGKFVTVEVVRPMHNTEFCSNCTRIRMSSDGLLKPCLLDHSGHVDVLTPLRNGASDPELHELFFKAVGNRRPYWS